MGQESDEIVARFRELHDQGVEREDAITQISAQFGRDADEVKQIVIDPVLDPELGERTQLPGNSEG
jgi:hypothetical protein